MTTEHRPNRLMDEKSPYLQQHAYNPVDWYPWGDEAFAAARREDKPVFLSIGYSTCHWCHVMERESFENEKLAAVLNEHFISIKVDREERPDIDHLYMIATQAMTGSGGWPMSVFLFPDRKPFYAGTYFPPEPRYNHPGFGDLLLAIARAWRENRDALSDTAGKIVSYIEDSTASLAAPSLKLDWSAGGFRELRQSYDAQFHGFGSSNKFPRPACLDFLHVYAHRSGDRAAFDMAKDTLRAMAMGGMYDHVGGGFHRYSVDRQWRIPHFEKMLYDQAQLVPVYLQMFQQTGERFFADVAEETVDYVLRDLRHPEGGFYSAEDADSVDPYDPGEHGEGAFYLWQESEIREVLDRDEADVFIRCYGVRPEGNALEDPAGEFTGRNILYLEQSLADCCADGQRSEAEVAHLLQRARQKLLHRREGRVRPHLDDKIITAWNGLMLSALARAGRILGRRRYIEEAERAAAFIRENLVVDGGLRRRWRDGEARFDGVLEDYAFFVQGLLDVYDASHESRYLHQAIDLCRQQLDAFHDSEGGFFTSRAAADLLTRMKESYDGAEPSGNSVTALNFLRLGRMLGEGEWTSTAEETIQAFGRVLESHGSAMPLMLTALEMRLAAPQQLIIAGRRGEDDTEDLLQRANSRYLPHLQILLADGGENEKLLARALAAMGGATRRDDRATAYLCRDYACRLPTSDAGELDRLLAQ